MNPLTVERQILVMLAAAAIPLGIGAAVQAREVLAGAAAQCDASVVPEPTVQTQLVAVPVVVPEVIEPTPDEPTLEPELGSAATATLRPGAFAFIVDLDGPCIVLSTEVDDGWADGQPRLENPSRVSAELAPDALPTELAALVGKKVDVYDGDGKQGVASIGRPRIVAEAEGDLSEVVDTYAAWALFEDPQRRVEVEEDLKLIEAVWDEGRRLVVAPLDTQAHGIWARLSSLPAPRVLTVEELDAATVEQEVPWAWQDPAVLDWTGGYGVYLAGTGEDEPVDLMDLATGTRWSDADGVGMVSFVIADPDDWCGTYGGGVWGAEDVSAGRKRAGIHGSVGPSAVFDLDGNGYLDVLLPSDAYTPSTLLLGQQSGFAQEQELPPVTFLGCPC